MTQSAPFFLAPGVVLAGAIVLGLLGGYAFQRIWRRMLPRAFSSRLLGKLPTDVRGMLTAEEPSEMLKHYKAVLLGILSWSGRNTAGLAIGLLPVGAAFLLLTAWDPSARLAAESDAFPTELARERNVAALEPGEKQAFCASVVECLLFEMMLFDTHQAADLERSIVVRPAFFDANPLWPYVNDLELAFFTAVMLGSAGAAWAHRERAADG